MAGALQLLFLANAKKYSDFEIGDELLTNDGKTTIIVDIITSKSESEVYDFTVKNDENLCSKSTPKQTKTKLALFGFM